MIGAHEMNCRTNVVLHVYDNILNALDPQMFAVHHGQLRHATILVQLGADVLDSDSQGKLPLHWAADLGDVELTRCLLEFSESGDDVVELDADGTAPLHLSVARGHIDVVELMVELRPRANFNIRDNTGRTPLHWAAASGYVDIVSLLCGVDGVDVDVADNYGATACHYAAQQPGSNECVLALLQHDAQCVADTDGRIPLHWAVLENNQPCVEALLSGDHRVEMAEIQDNDGRNALHTAAMMGSVPLCLMLIDCTDINIADSMGKTAIFPACEQGNDEMVALLVERGADLAHTDMEGRIPLHWACVNGHQHVASLLLGAGSPAETVDASGKTCLMFAAFQGNYNLVELILERGVAVDAQDTDGITAMHWAALEGFVDVVHALLEAGGNPNLMEVNDSKSTVLDYALINSHDDVMALLREHHALLNSEIQHLAAMTIQTAWRGGVVRRTARQQDAEQYAQDASPVEHEAATRIATSFRAFRARKHYRRMKKEHTAAMHARRADAATVIQRHVRGHQCRQALFRTKEGKAFQAHMKLRRAQAMRAQVSSYATPTPGNRGVAASSLQTRRTTTNESSRTPSPKATPGSRRRAPLDTGLKRTGKSSPKKAIHTDSTSTAVEEHTTHWNDFEFIPRAGESYVNAYIRFSKLKEQRRANQDKLLLAVLKQPLGPGETTSTSGGASNTGGVGGVPQQAPPPLEHRALNMLTSYKTKHVTRIMEMKRITRTQEVLHSVLTIQRAWRRYRTRKAAAADRGIAFAPISHYAKRATTARASVATDAVELPVLAVDPRGQPRGMRSRAGRTTERSLGVLRATGGHNRTSTRRKVLPAIPHAASPRRRVPRQPRHHARGSEGGVRRREENGGRGRQMPLFTRGSNHSQIASSNPAVQKKIELNALHAQAAAARTRARKGWNDDPHYEPVNDRFAKVWQTCSVLFGKCDRRVRNTVCFEVSRLHTGGTKHVVFRTETLSAATCSTCD